jgi:hypothetical protein
MDATNLNLAAKDAAQIHHIADGAAVRSL